LKGREAYENKLRQIITELPEGPGCYQYLDESGKVIYVGKAKNLKRRVSSYFNKEQQSAKTRILVSKISDLKYIIVSTEWDALLLENNLIKRYKPRYNILLKDDKTYPSICITKESFPRIFKTRKIIKNGSKYYGPYSHVSTLNRLMQLIHQLYKVRSCRQAITEEGIKEKKYKECLEYHIKNCKAPCIGLQSKEEYAEQILEIESILKGNITKVKNQILNEIKQKSANLLFEEASILKERYDVIKSFQEKSEVVSNTIDNVDVFSIEQDNDLFFINYMHVSDGCINQAFTFEFHKKLDETVQEMLLMGIVEMRGRYNSTSKEIIVPFIPYSETDQTIVSQTIENKGKQNISNEDTHTVTEGLWGLDNITWTIPQKGDKKKLLELSILNVKQYRADRLKQSDKLNPQQKHVRILKELQSKLGIDKIPMHIECFDNSHIMGTDAVAACVVYEGGKPSRKEYRLYNIKSGVGGDDYASMEEILERRYRRLLNEEKILPDLIIVDGGKGQMSIAKGVIDNLNIEVEIAGLVKNNHHKTSGLLYGFPQQEIGIKPDSELFRFLEQMQEEVHRVAINFHKKKRSKRQTKSVLTEITGVGIKTQQSLLIKFGSAKRVADATTEELAELVGKSKAEKIKKYFENKGNESINSES